MPVFERVAWLGFLAACAVTAAGCANATTEGPTDVAPADAVDVPDVAADDGTAPDPMPAEAAVEATDGDAVPGEAPAEGTADLATDTVPDGLPTALPFAYTRADDGTPLTDDETRAFTKKILGFLKQVHYFDHVLYTTYGVDASTGKKEWAFWYSEGFRKAGDLVTFYHGPNPHDGGHNLHDPLARALGDSLAAYLLLDDATAGRAAELLCKGLSASMLGGVHDASDPIPFIMGRNVVPGFLQEYLTHDGKRKAVDPSGYWTPYGFGPPYNVWNAERFEYPDNPDWGPVWVTSLRSKDDVPSLFRLVPILRYAAQDAKGDAVRSACTDALNLLEAFTKDIVDQGFRIRAKDADGKPYIPGSTGNADLDYNQKDISSFVYWQDAIPNGECNARRTSELIALHHAATQDCGRGEPNVYDDVAFQVNSYNMGICRDFHLAHLANNLVNRDDAAAAQVIDGLAERIAQEEALTVKEMKDPAGVYLRDLAVYLAQSHAFGFPLTSTEARMIQQYYALSVDRIGPWPYWDPWAASVPDGDHGGYRPPDCQGEGADLECWFGDQDLGQVFETCWSPFVNPAGARWLDCDIVRDPSQWGP